MEVSDNNRSFSEFAQRLLANPELQSSLLHLQHHSGFYINLLLYLLWLGKQQFGRVNKQKIRSLLLLITPWHKRVISELKFTHALLAHHHDAVSKKIKEALETEILKALVIEQQMLEESPVLMNDKPEHRSPKQCIADACASIAQYCEVKNELFVLQDQAALISLFQAIFEEMNFDQIESQINKTFSRFQSTLQSGVQLTWESF